MQVPTYLVSYEVLATPQRSISMAALEGEGNGRFENEVSHVKMG